jgi:hypothetical protein
VKNIDTQTSTLIPGNIFYKTKLVEMNALYKKKLQTITNFNDGLLCQTNFNFKDSISPAKKRLPSLGLAPGGSSYSKLYGSLAFENKRIRNLSSGHRIRIVSRSIDRCVKGASVTKNKNGKTSKEELLKDIYQL